jgi:pyridoxamine 5'-phosphate oxidase
MTLQELYDFAMANPICALATVDRIQPRVRMFKLLQAGDDGFYFATGTPKKVFSQIKENPLVEACFWNETQMMRVDGEIDIVDEEDLKKELFSRHEFLQSLLKTADHPWFVVLRVAHGTIDFTADAIGLTKIDSFEF